jgi:ATP-binding cassette subfamily B protein
MGYVSELYAPMKAITGRLGKLQASLASAERAFSLLDRPHDVIERPDARPIRRASGAISFRDVVFGYDSKQPILKGVSFEIPAGSRVGIVGRTGAGKTTLVNLLMRFYDPDQGTILLDGLDIRDYKVVDLRQQFSMVPQDPVLFSSSIAENIGYALGEPPRDEIERAARLADAHDFITALPDGYDTTVGERGMRLSGGERQRIAIARAFLKDSPMLILDEPTSAVDVRTEASIMAAMDRLMAGRTTFMIAHRLSTLDVCDVILRMNEGRIVVERGPASQPERSDHASVAN